MTLAAAAAQLETKRLRLRPLAPADAEGLHAVYSDAEAMRYWSSPPCGDLAEAKKWIDEDLQLAATGTAAFWAIALRETDKAVGKCTLIYYDEANRRAEIGYILHRAHWGSGLMSEALTALIDLSFGPLGLHRLEADTDIDNAASIALLEKLGFRREGYLPQRWRVRDEWRDSLFYGLLAPDWKARRR